MTPEIPDSAPAEHPPYTIEQTLSGIVMGLIVLITFGNVLARYFTSQSFAATEEFSIALLIVLSFLGSSAAFAFGCSGASSGASRNSKMRSAAAAICCSTFATWASCVMGCVKLRTYWMKL